MAHAVSSVMPEVASCNFATVKSTPYQCNTAFIFDPKLRTTNDIVFLRAWSLKIRISDVSSHHRETEQGSMG